MRRNSLKRRLLDGETVIGTMVQEVTNPSIAQVLHSVGFDFFMIDMEHGLFSLETAAQILRVGRILDMCPLVRVRSPEYHLIAAPLDHGAMGIMLPRVESRGEVETLVEAVKYPPIGKRGCSSDAPHSEYRFGQLAEFLETNNEDTLVIAQIERREAVDRIDEVLSTPGVDVALIGSEDLSVSLGVPGETQSAPVVEAIEKVIAAAERNDVVSAIHLGSVESLETWAAKGMRMLMYGSDLQFLMESSTEGLNRLRTSVAS
ncbi:MAG: aldolase/citrate lyase family protein [Dehalococcoidia bacterium]|nr:aldolase/citrate lyase family protein [Dehalococcoidia bacterium]